MQKVSVFGGLYGGPHTWKLCGVGYGGDCDSCLPNGHAMGAPADIRKTLRFNSSKPMDETLARRKVGLACLQRLGLMLGIMDPILEFLFQVGHVSPAFVGLGAQKMFYADVSRVSMRPSH